MIREADLQQFALNVFVILRPFSHFPARPAVLQSTQPALKPVFSQGHSFEDTRLKLKGIFLKRLPTHLLFFLQICQMIAKY